MYRHDRTASLRAQAPAGVGPAKQPVQAPERIAVGIVVRGGSVLVGRRVRAPLAGHAEFPGGKVRRGEAPERAVVREVREETGLETQVDALLSRRRWRYPHGPVDLHFFLCSVAGGGRRRPRAPFAWVALDVLSRLRFPPANAAVVRELVTRAPRAHGGSPEPDRKAP